MTFRFLRPRQYRDFFWAQFQDGSDRHFFKSIFRDQEKTEMRVSSIPIMSESRADGYTKSKRRVKGLEFKEKAVSQPRNGKWLTALGPECKLCHDLKLNLFGLFFMSQYAK